MDNLSVSGLCLSNVSLPVLIHVDKCGFVLLDAMCRSTTLFCIVLCYNFNGNMLVMFLKRSMCPYSPLLQTEWRQSLIDVPVPIHPDLGVNRDSHKILKKRMHHSDKNLNDAPSYMLHTGT